MTPVVLLTGGSGLLAVNWAAAMRPRLPVVLGINERHVTLVGVESRLINLDSVDSVLQSLDAVEPTLVVNTAGLTNVEACEADPARAEYVNVTLAGNVATACTARGVKLAHVSTDHLFSTPPALVDETEPPDPVNEYGRSKARAEQRVADCDADALVIRTNFYGWGTSYRRSFSDVIIDTLRLGKTITLFTDVHFTPILAETLAHAVHDLASAGASGIFDVVGDERLSKLEFGHRIAAHFQLDAGLIRAGALAASTELVRRPREMSLSNRKAVRVLDRPLGDVDAHLARLLEQEQSHLASELRAL